jgi:undecaprenyl diphosphate synthase
MMEIPRHVAIILDGNGRWAKSRNMPRNYGHVKGAANVEVICRAADDLGIKYLTVYLFSTENWRRSQDEVKALMKLFHSYTRTAIRQARENNMRCRVLGKEDELDDTLRKNLRELVESSKNNTGLNFQLAINYGSRDEIVRAVRKLSEDVKTGRIGDPSQITEETISSYLDTADIPDPDLLIRTSGEMRLSNYLMWQLSYAELYFTKTPWPAFSKKDLELAIEEYNRRTRRYGGLKKGEED